MSPYYQDDWLTVYLGDCREVMAQMEPESVHCVVTSPPYWGLRDYGTATWVGGDEACDHTAVGAPRDSRPASGLTGGKATVDAGTVVRDCRKCGAVRQDAQLGLEPTPEAYVEDMVAVFREVRRVLRSDGTLWLNLGDSYAGSSQTGGTDPSGLLGYGNSGTRDVRTTFAPPRGLGGLKPKDLVGIPWRVAFALQADGWYLRSDIIWAKPNPMPESVTDRPTKAHEYLFLLSKSPRYYFDADAVREAYSPATESFNAMKARYDPSRTEAVVVGRSQQDPTNPTEGTVKRGNGGLYLEGGAAMNPAGRNLRSVWTIATQPYPGAHFATFPRKLVEPCIKAGTSEKGVCTACGTPWRRIVERESLNDHGVNKTPEHTRMGPARGPSDLVSRAINGVSSETLGWRPGCSHPTDFPVNGRETGEGHVSVWVPAPVPATVLDPFAGSGTTAVVAQSLSRRAVLIDLNADYLGQVMDRNRDIPLGLGA